MARHSEASLIFSTPRSPVAACKLLPQPPYRGRVSPTPRDAARIIGETSICITSKSLQPFRRPHRSPPLRFHPQCKLNPLAGFGERQSPWSFSPLLGPRGSRCFVRASSRYCHLTYSFCQVLGVFNENKLGDDYRDFSFDVKNVV